MAEKEPVAVVLDFMERVNSGDVDSICAAMTPDHVFVDALGARFVSRETMRTALAAYYQDDSGLQSFARRNFRQR